MNALSSCYHQGHESLKQYESYITELTLQVLYTIGREREREGGGGEREGGGGEREGGGGEREGEGGRRRGEGEGGGGRGR